MPAGGRQIQNENVTSRSPSSCRGFYSISTPITPNSGVQKQNAVSAHLISEQILPFAFADP